MTIQTRHWIKPTLTLFALAILTWLAPALPLDPWNLLGPKKIAKMILALAIIQAFGSAMTQYLGTRTGAILTGFFGGLISSTATTAALAKKSKESASLGSGEILTFLSTTGAMLFEGIVLVIAGTTEAHLSNLVVFIGPILVTIGMTSIEYRKQDDQTKASDTSNFQILPILKLALFIVVIISVSKVFQKIFGQNGLLVITSLVSLFEIHGSIIVNVQLHESGAVPVSLLCGLLATSIAASYLSKLFLIATLGSTKLRSQVIKRVLLLFISLAISWMIAVEIA